MIGLTKSVAVDFVQQGIRCNSVCPGTVDSPSLQQRLKDTGDYNTARRPSPPASPWAASARRKRSRARCWTSEDGAFCTGQNFIIDGGITI